MSTAIQVVDYDADTLTLAVGFTDGTVYRYFGVKADEASNLTSHPSLGVAFNSNIRNFFPAQKVSQ